MRKALVAAALAPFLLVACGMFGHEPPKPAHRADPPWHPATAILLAYAGPDGSLTRVQLDRGLKRDFDKADVHHTGCLDENEVRIINEQRWKQDESTASPLIDFKQNGCVDLDEFAATARSLFEQLDHDGTGRLTAEQLKPGTPKPGSTPQSQPSDTGERRHRGGGGPPGG